MPGKLNGVIPAATGEFDDFQAALYVPLRIRNDLAMFRRQQLGERVYVALDQAFEVEHHAGASLRVDLGPADLSRQCGLHRLVDLGRCRQLNPRLCLAGIGVEYVAVATRGSGERRAIDVVKDLSHNGFLGRRQQ